MLLHQSAHRPALPNGLRGAPVAKDGGHPRPGVAIEKVGRLHLHLPWNAAAEQRATATAAFSAAAIATAATSAAIATAASATAIATAAIATAVQSAEAHAVADLLQLFQSPVHAKRAHRHRLRAADF